MDKVMEAYKPAHDEAVILTSEIDFTGRTVADIGCGIGRVTRHIAKQAEKIFAFDKPNLLELARVTNPAENISYTAGLADRLPLSDQSVDLALFCSSLHHIDTAAIPGAVAEAARILRPGGLICFLEPVAVDGTYYELAKLVEDEKEIQAKAYQAIKQLPADRYEPQSESFYAMERSFGHFVNQVTVYVSDELLRQQILGKARKVAALRSAIPEEAVFQSTCRLNILRKIS